MIRYLNKNKHYIVSILCLIMYMQYWGWVLFDGITGWRPDVDNNNSVDYAALKGNLSNWFSFFFMTDQTINMFLLTGIFYFKFYKSNTYKTIFFCTISYLIFNLFALTRYKWETITLWYSTYKTFSAHLFFPVTSILILYWIRKDIVLKWKWMFVCSFYLTIFYIAQMIIYYSVTYVNNDGVLTHLKIYSFFDFNVKVMCFPTSNIYLRYFFNIGIIMYTPLVGMVAFLLYKFVFNVSIEWFPFPITKEDKMKIHNIYIKDNVLSFSEKY